MDQPPDTGTDPEAPIDGPVTDTDPPFDSDDPAAAEKMPIDGAGLRELRVEAGVSLRRIARLTGLTHGHLSKMEKNEEHRPVTPIVLRAYEQETGAPLTEGFMPPTGEERRAYLSEAGARKFMATLAATAFGQPLNQSAYNLMAAYRRSCVPPQNPDDEDIATLRWFTELLANEQYSTSLAGAIAEEMLRYLARYVDAPEADARLWPVLVDLAVRAARGAEEQGRGHAGRAAYLVGLRVAARSGEPALRGKMFAAVSAEFGRRGFERESDELRRLADAMLAAT
jgi:transcriptional regulator with XRE-family HTH domain